MIEDNGINALLEARTRLDVGIKELLDKVAIMRKRADALQGAIDVLRSSDSDLRELLQPKPVVTDRDLEEQIIEFLGRNGAMRLGPIATHMKALCTPYKSGVIVKTCPGIKAIGKGSAMRYQLEATRGSAPKTSTGAPASGATKD